MVWGLGGKAVSTSSIELSVPLAGSRLGAMAAQVGTRGCHNKEAFGIGHDGRNLKNWDAILGVPLLELKMVVQMIALCRWG